MSSGSIWQTIMRAASCASAATLTDMCTTKTMKNWKVSMSQHTWPICTKCGCQLVQATRIKCILVLAAEHFRHEHYLCEDSICRQEHFQVWSTEAELQQHRVRVHGDNMSRHEKRQAMRIPLDINVSSTMLEQYIKHVTKRNGFLWCIYADADCDLLRTQTVLTTEIKPDCPTIICIATFRVPVVVITLRLQSECMIAC